MAVVAIKSFLTSKKTLDVDFKQENERWSNFDLEVDIFISLQLLVSCWMWDGGLASLGVRSSSA